MKKINKVIYILYYIVIWVLARISCHHVIQVCKSLKLHWMGNDMREKPHVIPTSRELQYDYYFEIARQWDEEDLTAPPQRPS